MHKVIVSLDVDAQYATDTAAEGEVRGMTDQTQAVTLTVTVTFPTGKFDTDKPGTTYDVTEVVRGLLTERMAFTSAEVRYAT